MSDNAEVSLENSAAVNQNHQGGKGAMLQNVTFGPPYASEGLSDIQSRAIEMILSGETDVEIARKLEVARMTLWRWKREDHVFRRELAIARQRLQEFASDNFQNALIRATSVLHEFLSSDSREDRFRAARTAINMASAFRRAPEMISTQPDLPPMQG